MDLDRHFPETQYLRAFWALLYYIVILICFLLLFLQLHFFYFTFYLQFSFRWFLHFNFSIRSISFIQPHYFYQILVHSGFCYRLHSIEIFGMNQPLCEKFWLNLSFWAIFSVFQPSRPFENLDFWLNYAVFLTFHGVNRPKTGQNGPGKHCQVNKEKAFPVISVLESPIC